jgi:hypothetical protein
MGVRGEIFSSRVILANRTYFFNVKENRMGDVYLNIVESKNRDNGGFDRQSVILFADDLQEFLKGFDESLKVLEKAVREKRRGGGEGAKREEGRDEKPWRGEKAGGERAMRGERTGRGERTMRGERAMRGERTGRGEKPWRGEKAGGEKTGRGERTGRGGNATRGGKDRYSRTGEKPERADRSQSRRSERVPSGGKRFVVKRQDRQP